MRVSSRNSSLTRGTPANKSQGQLNRDGTICFRGLRQEIYESEEFFRGAATHDATGNQDTRDIEPVVRHVPIPHDYVRAVKIFNSSTRNSNTRRRMSGLVCNRSARFAIKLKSIQMSTQLFRSKGRLDKNVFFITQKLQSSLQQQFFKYGN